MGQSSLFEDRKEIASTTAIYPNRIKDKLCVEHKYGLAEQGDATTTFLTPKGTLLAVGYVRVVYGDHGPYIEFSRDQIKAALKRKFNRTPPPDAYYEWLAPTDGSSVKIYDQKRDVKHIKNAPKGGYAGNRTEGYADYIPGMIYISPFEIAVSSNPSSE